MNECYPRLGYDFLLADDPGAGKTIMAGLLLKELKLRGVINYILILTPAPLTIQWQDELYSKFDETFEIVNSEMVGNQLAGNVWDRHRQCITSLDFAKQERVVQSLEQIPWDLVIIDEAHKCSARTQGEKVAKTKRYQLAERLSASAERILLLTATPHNGDPNQFAHFLRLLDADQFPDPRYDGLQLDRSIMEDSRAGGRDQWFLRRIKEELRDRDGNPLFTKRHARTIPFELTWTEKRLYDHVTQYINRFLPFQQGGTRRSSVALARTVLQRRLASSLNAIHRSLERRATKFKDILQELERVPASEHEKILQKYRLLASSGYEDEEREGDDLDEWQDEAMESFPVVLRVDQLRDEVHALENLVQEATSVMASGEESKLKALELTCSLCVDPQVASGPAAIALPEGWLADVAAQHNGTVGAKGDGVGDAIGQPNWLTALVRDARKHAPAWRGQPCRTGVEDLRSVGLPANHFRAPAIIGQPARRPAIGGHHIDFIRTFVTTSKGNLPTIRRKPRPGGCRHASGQSFGTTTTDGDTPEVILCRKDELIARDGRKAKIAGGSHDSSFRNVPQP